MIRKAEKADVDSILLIINDAKELFKNNNSLQWQGTKGYPNKKTVLLDIEKGWLYLACLNNIIVGIITLATDWEESYQIIEDGVWLNNNKYYTIHRLAIKKGFYKQGIAKMLISYIEIITKNNGVYNIRADTALDNKAMNNLLIRCGYQRCGIIYLKQTDCLDPMRIAYQKVLN